MIPQRSSEVSPNFDPSDWKLNRAQQKTIALWLSRKYPVIGLQGGWGSGKTRLCLQIIQVTHETEPGCSGFVLTDSMSRGSRTLTVEFRILEALGWTYKHSHYGQQAPHYLSPPINGKRSKVWILSWKRPSGSALAANSLEGPSVSFGIIDECNLFKDSEPARAALGRIRSGAFPRLLLCGKPTLSPWWLSFAEERGGVGFSVSSRCNRDNLPNFDAWLSSLSPREIQESIDCVPMPPEGAVFDMWSPEKYPKGNILPPDWKPEQWMKTSVSFDFGVRSPSAIVISHDPRIGPNGADVCWLEANPDRASVFEVCEMLRHGLQSYGIPGIYPAHRSHEMPEGSIPCSFAYGDRSGRNTRDDKNMSSAVGDVMATPEVGGLGLRCMTTDDPARININAGVSLLWRLMLNNKGERRLLCSHQLWNYGRQSGGRSFAKSITGYSWSKGSREIPRKDGVHDHACDALRYWAINARWQGIASAHFAKQAFDRSDPFSTPRPTAIGIDR